MCLLKKNIHEPPLTLTEKNLSYDSKDYDILCHEKKIYLGRQFEEKLLNANIDSVEEFEIRNKCQKFLIEIFLFLFSNRWKDYLVQ